MKKRLIVILTFILVFAVMNSVALAGGWKTDSIRRYELEDGTYATGWMEIEGNRYLFGADGIMLTGWQYEGESWYYMDPDSGAMQTGWLKRGGCTYYLADDGVLVTGWSKINGNWYLFAKGGAMQKGLVKNAGATYYLDENGIMRTGLIDVGGVRMAFAKNGALVRNGWFKNSGNWYYIDENGSPVTGWKIVAEKTYYLDEDGKMAVGIREIEGENYAFSKSGALVKNGWFSQNGTWYYINEESHFAKGWLENNGKKYYLDPETGAMTTGSALIEGKLYGFNTYGVLAKAGWYQVGEAWYHAGTEGLLDTGLKTIGKNTYLFDETSGVMQTGWKQIDGQKFFFKSSGAMAIGWADDQETGKRYYFDKDGTPCRGWVYSRKNWYYLMKTGDDPYMLTDCMVETNEKYSFIGEDGAMIYGSYIYDGVSIPIDASGYVTGETLHELLNETQFYGLMKKLIPPKTYEAQYPYYIVVNKTSQVVTVYTFGEDGKYTVPVKYMLCSTGASDSSTPVGEFALKMRYRWRLMVDDSYGQWATRIVGSILFHSIPTLRQDGSTTFRAELNKIGTKASHGCVRLLASEAKWIYDNCPEGTKVKIYNGPEEKELHDSLMIPQVTGGTYVWDPTDPAGDGIAPPNSKVMNTPYPYCTPCPTEKPQK